MIGAGLGLPAAAAAADTVQAVVAGRRYAVPRALLDGPVTPGEVVTDIFSMQLLWPGAGPLPAGHDTTYESSLFGGRRTGHLAHDTGRAALADPGAAGAVPYPLAG
ncbi:MAG: hypothetical protein EON48_19775 [Acetobacteraceae bacterium]|nr:MAG: hypothetical protein EON48_19775 [Acetobacteraceae bacterium]